MTEMVLELTFSSLFPAEELNVVKSASQEAWKKVKFSLLGNSFNINLKGAKLEEVLHGK